MGYPLQDLSGKEFGRWTVISLAGREKRRDGRPGQALWLCRCECGREGTIRSTPLRKGKSTSCGKCNPREWMTKHGLFYHPLYNVWNMMMQRCTNPGFHKYRIYGGRGIQVCERWRSVESFIEDMSPRPEGRSLERVDTNGNYSPENCRWATPREQSRNTRANVLWAHNGKTQCIADWAEELNIKYGTLRSRVMTYGWSVEKALTTPVRSQ